jgi:hypothetical protein
MRMVKTRIQMKALGRRFKGKTLIRKPRMRWFSQILKGIKKTGKSWQEFRRERLWEERRCWRLFHPVTHVKRM